MLSEASNQSELVTSNTRFNITNTIDQIPKCDFVIICVKSNQTKNLVNDIKSICHAETKIITLQNGLLKRMREELPQSTENLLDFFSRCGLKLTQLESHHADIQKLYKPYQYNAIKQGSCFANSLSTAN